MTQLILTAVGPDKPGLVGELSGQLHAGGGNILESRMVNLRGQFAVLVLVEGAAEAIAALREKLPAVGTAMGLRLTVHTPPALGEAAVGAGMPFVLKTYSLDQPGLVHTVTEVLRRHRVNIEELAAKQESAPFAGTPLFTMQLRLTVPAEVPVRQLRAELEAACEKANCDVDLEPA